MNWLKSIFKNHFNCFISVGDAGQGMSRSNFQHHELRRYVLLGTEITDSELDEIIPKIKDELNYSDSSKIVLTKIKADRDEFYDDEFQLVKTKKDIVLCNGETIYFASDYGYA